MASKQMKKCLVSLVNMNMQIRCKMASVDKH